MVIWKTCRLGEVVELSQGLAINSKTKHLLVPKSKLPLLKIRDLINNTQEDYVDEDKVSAKCIAKPNDLIFTRTGQVGLIFTGKIGVIHNNCFKVIPGKELNRMYLYWFLKQKEIIEIANSIASGSVQKDLNHSAFKSIDITFPKDLSTQVKIAEILSALDDKIELNRRMNQTLEQMAQTLFRQYFVEGIDADNLPEGWKVCEFGDYITTVSKTHKFPKSEIIFLNTSDIFNGNVLINHYSEVKSLPGQAKKSIEKGDILFSEIRPANKRFAFINFYAEDYVVSTKLMVLRPKADLSSLFFYFLMTREENLKHLQNIAESRSGTFPQITFDQVEILEFIYPNDNSLENFIEKVLEPTYQKIFKNDEEIKTLTNLRDTLLPKLMSGEIDVMQTQTAGRYEEVLS